MTVEQRAYDSTVQHSGEGLVMSSGRPVGNDLIAFGHAANPQALRICGPTAKANAVGRELFLQ
jgi:hypothetical protein